MSNFYPPVTRVTGGAVFGTVSFNNVKLNVYSFATDGVLIDTGAKSLLKGFKPFFFQADVDKVVIFCIANYFWGKDFLFKHNSSVKHLHLEMRFGM